ncbi:Crp/Fnr family transcriptional regulator [Paramaledivibacter caminithermalis]|jgi:CRP-like cAMP-binding protein|uniref:cAMP-binding domain of CRP or a regulatory subunit of cAMP-dependent protein kinases n=1 Tax=Paramaledivibacter caminithermalis (strain DSM 15212 / CIP 107654 / DViRD3) TaxID=1121301 RepID=A0A1M6P2W8_PARC5|nr:Crp/Fnr family transcriptional regulator [Paramaledivibacter caminithermalis]SHK02258.1 cAMP-binding domain of CRP or a regulatory subunit of cAMP-dependent protein kinases [Paramaledivibacter caminithermalis DSM 15212]
MKNILDKNELNSLKNCPLFNDVSIEEITRNVINVGWYKKNYCKNSIVLDLKDDFKGIAILLSGEITVNIFYENGDRLPLRYIKPSEVFGLSYFLSSDNNETLTFITNTTCNVLIINEDSLLKLLKSSSIILQNCLNYMNNRIRFLISKIIFFNLSNNQQKVCHFLLNECSKASSKNCCLNLPKTTLCEYLGIGRTSFYRELNVLAKKNAIKMNNNGNITIHPEKLIDILKGKYS